MTPTFLNYAWNCNYKHTTFHHIKLTMYMVHNKLHSYAEETSPCAVENIH